MAPDAPDLQVALGEALLQAQQVDRAVGAADQGGRGGPVAAAGARVARARAGAVGRIRAGRSPTSRRRWPTDVDGSVHYQLAQAMQRTGNPERAKALLAEYQKRSQAAAPAAATTPADVPAITPPVP